MDPGTDSGPHFRKLGFVQSGSAFVAGQLRGLTAKLPYRQRHLHEQRARHSYGSAEGETDERKSPVDQGLAYDLQWALTSRKRESNCPPLFFHLLGRCRVLSMRSGSLATRRVHAGSVKTRSMRSQLSIQRHEALPLKATTTVRSLLCLAGRPYQRQDTLISNDTRALDVAAAQWTCRRGSCFHIAAQKAIYADVATDSSSNSPPSDVLHTRDTISGLHFI